MLTTQQQAGIFHITLNRVERRNALCTAMMHQLEALLQKCTDDASVHAIVLSGAGSVFCAGSDIKELAPLDNAAKGEHEAHTAQVVRQIAHCPKPVIAAIEGYALGGGFALAMACDSVVAADNAKMAMPEVANGWIPPWGLTALQERCGKFHAQHIVWGAEALSVKTLQALGAVDCVVNEGQAIAEGLKQGHALSTLPSHAVQRTKRFFQTQQQSPEQADVDCNAGFVEDCSSPTAQATFEKFANPKQ